MVPVSRGMGVIAIAILIMCFLFLGLSRFCYFLACMHVFSLFLFVIASVFYMGDESRIVAALVDLLSYMVFLHCIVILAHN